MFKPMGNLVLLKPTAQQEMTSGGLVIPEAARERAQEYKVVAVGLGRRLANGEREKLDVKEGDLVLIGKFEGNDLGVGGENFVIASESDILAVIA